jgi:hypothetical protein
MSVVAINWFMPQTISIAFTSLISIEFCVTSWSCVDISCTKFIRIRWKCRKTSNISFMPLHIRCAFYCVCFYETFYQWDCMEVFYTKFYTYIYISDKYLENMAKFNKFSYAKYSFYCTNFHKTHNGWTGPHGNFLCQISPISFKKCVNYGQILFYTVK